MFEVTSGRKLPPTIMLVGGPSSTDGRRIEDPGGARIAVKISLNGSPEVRAIYEPDKTRTVAYFDSIWRCKKQKNDS